MKRLSFFLLLALLPVSAWGTEISWWKLDGNPNDSVGSHNGTNINTPTYVTGKLNQGISLTQSSTQYVQIADATIISTDDWSLCAWVQPVAAATDRYIFSSGDSILSPGTFTSGFQVRIRTTDTIRVTINTTAGNQTVTSTGTIPEDGSWTHVCAVKNGTSAKIFINKVEDGSFTLGASTMNWSGDSGEVHTRIGDAGLASQSFDGLIDEVHLYDAAIDQTTINALFDSAASSHRPISSIVFQ